MTTFDDLLQVAMTAMATGEEDISNANELVYTALLESYFAESLTFLSSFGDETKHIILRMMVRDLLDEHDNDRMGEIMGDSIPSSSSSINIGDVHMDYSSDEIRTRYHYKSNPGTPGQYESNWFTRFLQSEEHIANITNPTHPRGIEFRSCFGVPFEIFTNLLSIIEEKNWYDDSRFDAVGNRCSDVRLLLLGTLNQMAQNATPLTCTGNTNISATVHRVFTRAIREEFFFEQEQWLCVPSTPEELNRVTQDYERLGIPGVAGSMDVVHRGWDKCPSELTPLFKGKEGYPTVAFEVVTTHRREVLYVSKGYPGTRNDKQIVKVDALPILLHDKTSFLATQKWTCVFVDGTTHTFDGYWFLVDGGYLRWPCLICPIALDNDRDICVLGKRLTSIRKDVECLFGILKKRFKCLKAWTELRKLTYIEHEFVMCCILHNMLLKHDGYLDGSYDPDASLNIRDNGTWTADSNLTGAGPNEDDAVKESDESEWIRRNQAIAQHYKRHLKKNR